jgi:hypothetical protein
VTVGGTGLILMGNSPEICHKHYGKLVSSYDAPLWAAVNGRTKG